TYLVPRNALLRNADGAHVLAAGHDGELKKIAVTAERLQGPNWVVTQGLTGGERIVVENAAHLAAGQKIKPVERAAPSAQPLAHGNPEGGSQARTPAPGQKG
ncbi:efflux transporter periplasmic adaptor subunit, partial [Achromobacter insolitus]|nr:efflux transporter periplasmic adaptor subunit [Achromobacter insolitus]